MTHPKFLALALVAFMAFAAPAHADVAAGNNAYHTYCVSCHGDPPRGGPETAANNPDKIRNALNTVGAMVFLRGQLTTQQINDIAEYLGSLNAPPPPAGPAVPAFNYSDLWWNPNESGWGLNLVQHSPSNNIFGVIYTYDSPQRPMWFVMPGGTWTSSTTFTASLYSVTGFPGNMTFRPNDVRVLPVGTATILFADPSHATMTYSVNGSQVTKSIERQPF